MTHLLYEALQGINFDGQTAEFLLDSPGLDDFSSSSDTEHHQTITSTELEADLFQCGKCKKQFNSFQLFALHKKEHGQGSLSKVGNNEILLSLDEDKDNTCSTNNQIINQLTVDTTLAAEASGLETPIIFSENDILSFAIDASSLSLSPPLETPPPYPCVMQPEEFLSPSTGETASTHKGNNSICDTFSCTNLDSPCPVICNSQLIEDSTAAQLPSIHSITDMTKDTNIEASLDAGSKEDVNFSVSPSEEKHNTRQIILPEINGTSGAVETRIEQIINYEELSVDDAATILLDYSNGQTLKSCSNLLAGLEITAVRSIAAKNIDYNKQNELKNSVIECANSFTQTNNRSVETEHDGRNVRSINIGIKEIKTKRNTAVPVVDKLKRGILTKNRRLVEINTNKQDEQSSRSMLQCNFCTKLFTKNFDLQQHIRSHTGEKPFQCVVCGRAFSQKSNAKKHMKSHKVWPRDQTSFPKKALQLLGKENDGKRSDKEGCEEAINDSVIDCPTLKKTYVCQFCEVTFSTYVELKSHMKNHSDQKVYKCLQKHCPCTFPDLESFLEHTNNHHINGLHYCCYVCNKRFDSLESLGLHQYTHGKTATKPLASKGLVCSKCKRKFNSQAALEHHMVTNTHHFPCPFCGKVFTGERYLRRHLIIHGPEKAFTCSVCGKYFRAEMYLKSHMLIHSNERPFACQQCNATFIRKDKLARHLLIHQSVKKFKCPFFTYLGCSKEFSRQDKLKRHILTHTLTKQIRCKKCNRTFHHPSKLREHDRLHCPKNLKKKCFECGIVFRSKVQLSSHLCNNEPDPAVSTESTGTQENCESVPTVKKTSKSKRKVARKGSKMETSKTRHIHGCGAPQTTKDLSEGSMSTIEIIVVPVSVHNTETIENNPEDGSLYVTYPSTKDIASCYSNPPDLYAEAQMESIIFPTNQLHDENIPELNIGSNCDNLKKQ